MFHLGGRKKPAFGSLEVRRVSGYRKHAQSKRNLRKSMKLILNIYIYIYLNSCCEKTLRRWFLLLFRVSFSRNCVSNPSGGASRADSSSKFRGKLLPVCFSISSTIEMRDQGGVKSIETSPAAWRVLACLHATNGHTCVSQSV